MSTAGGAGRYDPVPLHDHAALYPPRSAPPPAASSSSSSEHSPSAAFSAGSAFARRTSSKGKGKERALPDDADEGGRGLSFGIRFTDGQTPDLVDLWVGHRETVRDLKRRVCHAQL